MYVDTICCVDPFILAKGYVSSLALEKIELSDGQSWDKAEK